MIHATHCLESGAYYYEVKIENNTENNSVPDYARKPHYRVGWCLKGAFDKGPCGFDKLSYGYGSKDGKVYHKSKGIPYGEPFGEAGDVIGCYIEIPKVEMPPIKYIESAFFGDDGQQYKQFTATLDEKAVVGSKIVFFKNGKYQGIAFSDIMFGAYFPAISLYMNACVTVRFEANQFQYNPHDCNPEIVNKNWKAIGELRKRTKPASQKPQNTPSKDLERGEFKAPKPRHREALKSSTGSMVEAARKLHSSPSNPRHSKIASASTQSIPLHNDAVSKKHKKNKSSSAHPKQPKQASATATHHCSEGKKSSSSKHNKKPKDLSGSDILPSTSLSASSTHMNQGLETLTTSGTVPNNTPNMDQTSAPNNDIAVNSSKAENTVTPILPQNIEKKKPKKHHESSSGPKSEFSKKDTSSLPEKEPQDLSKPVKVVENVPATTIEEKATNKQQQKDDTIVTSSSSIETNNPVNQALSTTLQQEFAQIGLAISNIKDLPKVETKTLEHPNTKKATSKLETDTSPRLLNPQPPTAMLSVSATVASVSNEQQDAILATPSIDISPSSTIPPATTTSHQAVPPISVATTTATTATYITNMSDKPLAHSTTATPTKERKSKTAKAESSLMVMARKTQVDHNPKKGIGLLKNKKDETAQHKTPLKRKNSLSKEEEHVAVHHHTTKLVDPPKSAQKKKPEESKQALTSSSEDVNNKILESGSNVVEAPEQQHLTVAATVDDLSPTNKKRKTSKEIPYEHPSEKQTVRSELTSTQHTHIDTINFATKASQPIQQQSHPMNPQQLFEQQLLSSERLSDVEQGTPNTRQQQAQRSQQPQQQQPIRQEHVEQFMPNMLVKQNQSSSTFNPQSQESMIRSRSNSFQSLLNAHPQQQSHTRTTDPQQVNPPNVNLTNYQINKPSQHQKFAPLQETSMLNAFNNLSTPMTDQQQPSNSTVVSSSRTEQYSAPMSFRELLFTPTVPTFSQQPQSSLSTNVHAHQIESSTMQGNLMNHQSQFNPSILMAQSHHQQAQQSQQQPLANNSSIPLQQPRISLLAGNDQKEQFSMSNTETFVDSFNKYMAPRKLSDPPQPATPVSAQSQQRKQTFNPTQFIQRNVSNAALQHNHPSGSSTSGNYHMMSQQQQQQPIQQSTSNAYHQISQPSQSNLPQTNSTVASMHQPYAQQQQTNLHQAQMRPQFGNFGASIMSDNRSQQLPSISDSFTSAAANRSSLLTSMPQQTSTQPFLKQQMQHSQQFHQQMNLNSPTAFQHVQNYPSQHHQQQHFSSSGMSQNTVVMSQQSLSSNHNPSFMMHTGNPQQSQHFAQQPSQQQQHNQYLSNPNNYRGSFQQ